jgi:hypothetical protein
MKRQALAMLVSSMLVCPPALAAGPFDGPPNSTMFYVSIPLDAKTRKEDIASFGLTIRGSREYQYVNIDSRFMSKLADDEALGGIGAEWLIVGGVAALAAIAVGSKDSSVATQQQQQQTAQQQQAAQQQQQQQQAPAPCPVTPPTCFR